MPQIHFGWRAPDWPEGNRTTQEFITDMRRTLDVVSAHFASAAATGASASHAGQSELTSANPSAAAAWLMVACDRSASPGADD